MNLKRQWGLLIGTALFVGSPLNTSAEYPAAAGMQQQPGYSSQYNPWRKQQPQHRGYWGQNNNGNGHRSIPTPQQGMRTPFQPTVRQVYMPQSPIPARQHEYRSYIQQVNPYYSGHNTGPWWSDSGAIPNTPWAIGNGWPNGIW